jgi:ATP-binding cassette subfamily A (ABC1) protein 3
MRNTESIKNLEGTADGIIATFIFCIALSFIPASLITFTVKEREDQVKHQHLVSGVSLLSYWLSNYFMDFAKHLMPAVFSILMMLAFNITVFTDESRTFGAVSLLFLLYGWSIIPFSYLFGFLFKSYGNA